MGLLRPLHPGLEIGDRPTEIRIGLRVLKDANINIAQDLAGLDVPWTLPHALRELVGEPRPVVGLDEGARRLDAAAGRPHRAAEEARDERRRLAQREEALLNLIEL